MHERIVEILVVLMEQLRSRTQMADLDVSTLSGQGYSPSEISSAVSFLFDKFQGRPADVKGNGGSPRSMRVLHPLEHAIILPEGFGYLTQCHQLGLLTAPELESVIERIMMSGIASAGEEEVKSAIALLLFGLDRPGAGSTSLLGPTDAVH